MPHLFEPSTHTTNHKTVFKTIHNTKTTKNVNIFTLTTTTTNTISNKTIDKITATTTYTFINTLLNTPANTSTDTTICSITSNHITTPSPFHSPSIYSTLSTCNRIKTKDIPQTQNIFTLSTTTPSKADLKDKIQQTFETKPHTSFKHVETLQTTSTVHQTDKLPIQLNTPSDSPTQNTCHITDTIEKEPQESSKFSTSQQKRRETFKRRATKETRKTSLIEFDGGWTQLNQYKFKEEIGKVSS